MRETKMKIAVLYAAFMGGGAEAVCAWMLEALKDAYDVTLFTFVFKDLDELNRLYGTDLRDKDVRVIRPVPWPLVGSLKYLFNNVYHFHALRQRLLSLYFRRHRGDFDLAISGYNEMDLSGSGIQYIHRPGVVTRKRAPLPERIRSNITVTNSEFTARSIKDRYALTAQVLYPPVTSAFHYVPWEKKENGFVCVGRLVEAKAAHIVIGIIEAVRARGFDVHLHIIGSGGNVRYIRYLKKLADERSSWVRLDVDIPEEELSRVLAEHKYGIHAKEESFGIVVAEMMRSGAIVFTRKEGGQLEIIGKNDLLTFATKDESVEKITKVLSDEGSQNDLRASLSARKSLFSEKRFIEEFRQIVEMAGTA
jgi:glycosyltransferase involved in cell wall biosynthesis